VSAAFLPLSDGVMHFWSRGPPDEECRAEEALIPERKEAFVHIVQLFWMFITTAVVQNVHFLLLFTAADV
jgi:hypothetical protein